MRALLALTLVLPAAAVEGDPPVTLAGRRAAGIFASAVPRGAGLALQLGPSDPFAEPYDSVLFHGELPDSAVSFEVSREENGTWSVWVKARLARSNDGRFWAKAVFRAPGTGRLRVRALAGGRATGAPITIYGMQVFLSGAPPAPAPGTRPSEAREGEPPVGRPHGLGGGTRAVEPPVGRPHGLGGGTRAVEPPVVEREAWGARPAKAPYEPQRPDRLTQHHTQGRRPLTLEESLKELRFLQDFHQNGRGWNDIGYHYLVDAEGRVFRGRPVEAVGAHVKNDNTGNVGVSFMGSHHPPFDHPVAAEQLAASARVGRWLESAYGVSPDTLKGHRDRGKTDCPGDVLYPLLGRIKDEWRGTPPVGASIRSRIERFLRSFSGR